MFENYCITASVHHPTYCLSLDLAHPASKISLNRNNISSVRESYFFYSLLTPFIWGNDCLTSIKFIKTIVMSTI